MRVLQLVFALAFLGWCFYAGVYVPSQYGAYDRYDHQNVRDAYKNVRDAERAYGNDGNAEDEDRDYDTD